MEGRGGHGCPGSIGVLTTGASIAGGSCGGCCNDLELGCLMPGVALGREAEA